jgi:hypothetical protein
VILESTDLYRCVGIFYTSVFFIVWCTIIFSYVFVYLYVLCLKEPLFEGSKDQSYEYFRHHDLALEGKLCPYHVLWFYATFIFMLSPMLCTVIRFQLMVPIK